MSLTEIMSGAELSIYPQIAMILFLGVFLLISLRVLLKLRSSDAQKFAQLALDDDPAAEAANNSQHAALKKKGETFS